MTGLVTMLLTICLGQACRTERVPAESLMACMVSAQMVAAQHVGSGERLVRVRCEVGERA